MASASRLSWAEQGHFAKGLAAALRNPPVGKSQRYASLDVIVDTINNQHGEVTQQVVAAN